MVNLDALEIFAILLALTGAILSIYIIRLTYKSDKLWKQYLDRLDNRLTIEKAIKEREEQEKKQKFNQ